MFTFVIWAVGLLILLKLAWFNVWLIGATFEDHPVLAVALIPVSLAGWIALLAAIL